MVRISAVVVALIVALFLGLTITSTLDRPQVVLPTGGVIDGGPRDAVPSGPDAVEALRRRTELQRWRAISGPSPERPASAGLSADPPDRDLETRPAQQLVDAWQGERDEDWQLLQDRGYTAGTVNLPIPHARVLVQPQGRNWRRLHNEEVTYGGSAVIFGMALLLALFLALRGRIRVKDGESGEDVGRFNAFERANHWVTATSFVVMALTGLLLLYGQYLLKPLIGAAAYSGLASASAYVHIAFAIPFVLGVCAMIVLWLRQNLLNGVDLRWLSRGGGLLSERQKTPPAYKFNAGQKLIFWAVVLSMLALLATGLSLVFPFFWLNILGMQVAELSHAAVGLIMVAIILAHIYIGTVGMEGAFRAMWSGTVDRNWAEEHHSLWMRRREDHEPAD